MALLRVEHLKKYYPVSSGFFGKKKFVRALDDISFELHKGETLGLVGESGCGKSTLARQLIRLEEPTEGKIFLEECELTSLRGEVLRKKRNAFQMIFQDPYSSLNPRMSIFSALEEPLKLHTDLDRAGREARVAQLLELVGLRKEHAYRYPHQFSGGQRQRIGIARALAVHPRFIVADEPVSALDVSVQAQVVNLLQDIQKATGISYLFIAHDLAVVEHISHRIMVMYLGKCVECGPSRPLCSFPAHPYTKALLSSVPVLHKERPRERVILSGDVPSPLSPPSGCRFHPRCPFCREICRRTEPPLKEVPGRKGHVCACHFPDLAGK